jgi:hypothetical protein
VCEFSESTVESREQSLQTQLSGVSSAATKAQAERGVEAARADLASGYGVDFGFIKSLGSPGGLDGVKLRYAVVADDGRQADIDVVVSGTALAMLGHVQSRESVDESIQAWISVLPAQEGGLDLALARSLHAPPGAASDLSQQPRSVYGPLTETIGSRAAKSSGLRA